MLALEMVAVIARKTLNKALLSESLAALALRKARH